MKVKALWEIPRKATTKSRTFVYTDLDTGENKTIKLSRKYHKANINLFLDNEETEINLVSSIHNIY